MLTDKLTSIQSIFSANDVEINSEGNRFFAKAKNQVSFENLCKTNSLETERQGEKILLKIKSFLNGIDLISFSELETYFEYDFITKDFVILSNTGEYYYYQAEKKSVEASTSASADFLTKCKNIFSYYILYDFLKSEDFSDHHNDANSEIVIYSSSKGIFRIIYDSLPIIEDSKDIAAKITKLISRVEPVQIRSFFKNALFTFSNGKGIISINEIINKTDELIDTAERDFELASKQFDFDKFRDSLHKEKEKYFNSIRDIINKIFSQAIGIPISITATVFATYKVNDDNVMLSIVLSAFLLYVCFYIKIQLVYKADIKELKNDFLNDFEIIKSKSGLPEKDINSEKSEVDRKLNSSLSMINWLIGTVIGLGLLVACYILYEIGILKMFTSNCFQR